MTLNRISKFCGGSTERSFSLGTSRFLKQLITFEVSCLQEVLICILKDSTPTTQENIYARGEETKLGSTSCCTLSVRTSLGFCGISNLANSISSRHLFDLIKEGSTCLSKSCFKVCPGRYGYSSNSPRDFQGGQVDFITYTTM